MKKLSDRYLPTWPMLLLLAALYGSGVIAVIPGKAYPEPAFLSDVIDYSIIFSQGTLSKVLAGIALAVEAVIISMIESRVIYYRSNFLPLVYLCCTVSNPYALCFSPLHIATIFLTLHIYFCINYRISDERADEGSIGFANLSLALAILAWPPVLWLTPFSLIINPRDSQNRIGYIATYVSALLASILIAAVIEYLFSGIEASINLLSHIWEGCTTIPQHTISLPLTRIIMIAVIFTGGIAILVNIMKNFNKYCLARYQALKLVVLYTGPILLLALIFRPFANAPVGMIMFVPLSILANDSLHNHHSAKFTNLLIATAIIIAAAERIALLN